MPKNNSFKTIYCNRGETSNLIVLYTWGDDDYNGGELYFKTREECEMHAITFPYVGKLTICEYIYKTPSIYEIIDYSMAWLFDEKWKKESSSQSIDYVFKFIVLLLDTFFKEIEGLKLEDYMTEHMAETYSSRSGEEWFDLRKEMEDNYYDYLYILFEMCDRNTQAEVM